MKAGIMGLDILRLILLRLSPFVCPFWLKWSSSTPSVPLDKPELTLPGVVGEPDILVGRYGRKCQRKPRLYYIYRM